MYNNDAKEYCLDIGEASIPYLDFGVSGPTIVFLHATGFSPWLWLPVARHLKDDFHIVAPFFCNHRKADPEKGGFSWLTMAQDLTRFCEALEIKNPFMVGHSMGGAIMSIAGGKFGINIAKLQLIEPIIFPQEMYKMKETRLEDHPVAGRTINRRNFWTSEEEARQYLQSKPLFSSWDKEMLDLYIKYGLIKTENEGLKLACHPRNEASIFVGGSRFNPWPTLDKITCPVLVMEGEHTEYKGLLAPKRTAQGFPNGRYLEVKNAGHLIPMEKPEETAKITHSFFNE